MKKEILIVGTGGQGIKTIEGIIAYAVIKNDLYVSSYSAYTPRARGGDIVSHIAISDEPLLYPLTEEADLIIALSDIIPEKLVFPSISQKTKIIFDKKPQNLPRDTDNQKIEGLTQEPFSNFLVLGTLQKLIPEIPEKFALQEIEKFDEKNFQKNKQDFHKGQNLI